MGIEQLGRFCPGILVEGLNNVVRLGEGLPKAKTKGDLDISQMANDDPSRPFPGSVTSLQTLRPEATNFASELTRSFLYDFEGAKVSQLACVWIHMNDCMPAGQAYAG